MKCGTCKHWGAPAEQTATLWDWKTKPDWPNRPKAVTRPCTRLIQFFEYSKGTDGLNDLAFLDESDMYGCNLLTTAEFFCAHYEHIEE